jgi:hypothetical protein
MKASEPRTSSSHPARTRRPALDLARGGRPVDASSMPNGDDIGHRRGKGGPPGTARRGPLPSSGPLGRDEQRRAPAELSQDATKPVVGSISVHRDSFTAHGHAEGPPMPDPPQVSNRARGLPDGATGPSAKQARNSRWGAALAVLACLVCVLAVAGVFVLNGTGLPQPSPAAAPPPPQNRYGAPVSTNPRDVRPLEANVCGALDPAQWTALNIQPAGRPGRAMTGWPTCDWKGVPDPELVRTLGPDLAESSEHVSISATSTNDDLVGVYASHMFTTTQATTIGGLPALVGQDPPYLEFCDITIGTAIGTGMDVDYDAPTDPTAPANACPKALRIAEAVVARLPPLAP